MARGFRIHSGAVFNPFSYQEMLAPLAQAQTAYNQMQDTLLAAGEEANQYKQLIDTDEYASGVLQGYNNALQDAATKLNNEGLRGMNRSTLLRLRKAYNEQVKPVNDAAKTLVGLQDAYRQAYMKDNTLMRGAMPSIRDLVENPGATPQVVSGTQLYNQGAAASKSASLRRFKETELGKELIHGYFKLSQERGYSPDLVNAFMQDASQIPELATEIANIQQMYNTAGLQDPQQANRFIMQGILDGIQYDRKTDYKYDQLGAEYRTAARKAAGTTLGNSSGLLKPYNIYSQKERSDAAKNIDKFEKMFAWQSDGSWALSDEGRKYISNYNKTQQAIQKSQDVGWGGRSGYRNVTPDFIEFINTNKKEGETPEQTWTRYYNEHRNETYDAHKDTGYRYIPQSDDASLILNLVQRHGQNNDGNLNTVDYVSGRGYVENPRNKDAIKAGDFKTVTDLGISKEGIVVNGLDKNGGDVQTILPRNISPRHYDAITTNARHLETFDKNFLTIAENLARRIPDISNEIMQLYNEQGITGIIPIIEKVDGQQAAGSVYSAYNDYLNTQQAIYSNLADLYRGIDAKVNQL